MKKKLTMLFWGMILAVAMTITAFASQTGWRQVNSKWYYVNQEGSYHTGWLDDNGTWYYMDETGMMLVDSTTPDGYYVDANGVWTEQKNNSGSQALQLNLDYSKYFDYTDQQLSNEFHSCVISTYENIVWSSVDTLYYNGEIGQIEYGMIPYDNPVSNTVLISVTKRNPFDNGGGGITNTERDVRISVRAANLFNGITENTTWGEIASMGQISLWAADGVTGIDLKIKGTDGKIYSINLPDNLLRPHDIETYFIKDVDYNSLTYSLEKYLFTIDSEQGEREVLAYLKDKKLNPSAYLSFAILNESDLY